MYTEEYSEESEESVCIITPAFCAQIVYDIVKIPSRCALTACIECNNTLFRKKSPRSHQFLLFPLVSDANESFIIYKNANLRTLYIAENIASDRSNFLGLCVCVCKRTI